MTVARPVPNVTGMDPKNHHASNRRDAKCKASPALVALARLLARQAVREALRTGPTLQTERPDDTANEHDQD